MKRLVLFCALSLSLAACATPQVTRIPVAIPCPPPPAVVRPRLPIADLTPDSRPAEVLKAYSLSIEKLKGYAAELEEILKGYR